RAVNTFGADPDASLKLPDRLVFLAPLTPAPTGNGLAMRLFAFLRAACRDFGVHVVIVPVAGAGPGASPELPDAASVTVVALPDAHEQRADVIALMADPRWRERLQLTAPLPAMARFVSPILAERVRTTLALDPSTATAVHVARTYLAPLGAAL